MVSLDISIRAVRILVSLNLFTLVNNQTSTASIHANWFAMPGVLITKPGVISYLMHFEIAMAGFGTGEPAVIEMYLC